MNRNFFALFALVTVVCSSLGRGTLADRLAAAITPNAAQFYHSDAILIQSAGSGSPLGTLTYPAGTVNYFGMSQEYSVNALDGSFEWFWGSSVSCYMTGWASDNDGQVASYPYLWDSRAIFNATQVVHPAPGSSSYWQVVGDYYFTQSTAEGSNNQWPNGWSDWKGFYPWDVIGGSYGMGDWEGSVNVNAMFARVLKHEPALDGGGNPIGGDVYQAAVWIQPFKFRAWRSIYIIWHYEGDGMHEQLGPLVFEGFVCAPIFTSISAVEGPPTARVFASGQNYEGNASYDKSYPTFTLSRGLAGGAALNYRITGSTPQRHLTVATGRDVYNRGTNSFAVSDQVSGNGCYRFDGNVLNSAFMIGTVNDRIADDSPSTYTVTLLPSSDGSYVLPGAGDGLSATFTFVDDDDNHVSIITDNATAIKGGVDAVVRIIRSGNNLEAMDVPWTIGGTAVPGVDYTALPATCHFDQGVRQVTLSLNMPNDAIHHHNRSLKITLTPGMPFNQSPYRLDAPSMATLALTDLSPVTDVIINAVIVSGADTPANAVESNVSNGVTIKGGIIALGGTPVTSSTMSATIIPDGRYLNGTWIPPLIPYGIDIRTKKVTSQAQ